MEHRLRIPIRRKRFRSRRSLSKDRRGMKLVEPSEPHCRDPQLVYATVKNTLKQWVERAGMLGLTPPRGDHPTHTLSVSRYTRQHFKLGQWIHLIRVRRQHWDCFPEDPLGQGRWVSLDRQHLMAFWRACIVVGDE